jgi:hypothetical protein
MKSYEQLTVKDSVKIHNSLLKIKDIAGRAQCCMAQAVILREGESQLALLGEVPKFVREVIVWAEEILVVCGEPIKKNQSSSDDRLKNAMKLLREAMDICVVSGVDQVDDGVGWRAWFEEAENFLI